MTAACDPAALPGIRDRAVLLLGFASGLRRGELAALEVGHIDFCDEGVRLRVVRSKTDPEGRGEVVGIVATGSATCPVAALRSWMQAAGTAEDPVFRSIDRHGRLGPRLSGKAVGLIVKRRAEAVGLDPAAYSGHSLRSGHATEAAAAALRSGTSPGRRGIGPSWSCGVT